MFTSPHKKFRHVFRDLTGTCFFWSLFVSLGSILFLTGCRNSEPLSLEASPIVAMIDGEEITQDDFLLAFRELQFGKEMDEQSEEGRKIKRSVLDRLIEEKLILAEAGRLKLTVPDNELDHEINLIRRGFPEEDFNRLLEDQSISFADWKEQLRREMRGRKVIESTVPRNFEISDEEIKTFYGKNREEFREQETVRARHIVVQSEQTALDIRERLGQGESFEELARKYSFSPDKDRGGDMGFFSKEGMPEEFDIVFNLKINEISPVVQTPYGHHIFKLEERRKSRLVPLEGARDKINRHLSDLRHEKLFALWVEGLRERARITINEGILHKPSERALSRND